MYKNDIKLLAVFGFYLIPSGAKCECGNCSWITMINTKPLFIKSIPSRNKAIWTTSSKCLVLQIEFINCVKYRNLITFWWKAIALTGYISSRPSVFCRWHLKAYLKIGVYIFGCIFEKIPIFCNKKCLTLALFLGYFGVWK